MSLAYSYIRFSSPKQMHGASYVRQMEECQKYCVKHGLQLATDLQYTFFDKGVSGFKGDHVGEKGKLAEFLRYVEDGTIPAGSTLVIESLDRLSREQVDIALTRFLGLLRSGINIVTLIDERLYKPGTKLEELMYSIIVMSRANEESATKSKRVRDAISRKHTKARENGTPMGRAIPLWLILSSDSKQFVVNEERADVVRRIFDMAVNGYGRTATAKALNADGVASFKGTTWGTSSIEKVLNNRAVLGEYQPMSVQVDASNIRQPSGPAIIGYYPEIVSESMFYLAKSAIEVRKVSGASKQSKDFNVWQGIAKCLMCGTAMHLVDKGSGPKGRKYLHCFKARKGLCEAKAIRLDFSEKYFAEILAKLDSLPLVRDSSQKIEKDLARVNAIISEKKVKLTDYVALFEAKPSTSVNDLISRTEQEIKVLEDEGETLFVALAEEEITDKSQFLAKLDLVSYEGRSRANTLLKRLQITVLIDSDYYVVHRDNEPIFYMGYFKDLDRIYCVPMVKEQLDRMMQQGDGTYETSLFEMRMIELFAKNNGLDPVGLMESYMEADRPEIS